MAGLVPPAVLEQIRSASDIVDIIGGYLPLKRAGANFTALCPFHKEKSPSFNVNPHRQIFHCFGCHKGGDVFTFVKEYENIGFMDAIRRLAERAKIPLEFENTPGQQQARHIKDTLLTIHEQITQRWQTALANDANGQIARDYLHKRGVTDEAVQLFRLGYAPDLWDDTVNWSKSKSFDLPLVEQAGLILKKEGGGYYDRFRGRLMFPICDEQGRVIAFSGRILTGDEKSAKYVNSPETPIFTKGKVFFGLDKSKRALLDAKFAVVCEGQLDLIACFMAGVKNMVAPQGTALTPDHARILKRYVEEVVLCFDSDNAGQNAAVRSLDSLLAAGLAVRVATLPAGHDPDSFLKENGAEVFHDLVRNADGFFDYFLNRLCATNDVNTDKGRVAVVRAMGENLRKTDNTVLTDKYTQKTAMRLGVSAASVRSEFKKMGRGDHEREESDSFETEEPIARPSAPELWLLKALLQTDDLVEWVGAHLELDWLVHATTRRIVEQRIEKMREDRWIGMAAWLEDLEDEQVRSFVTEILADERPATELEKILKGEPGKKGIVELLRDKYVDRQLAAINQRMADPNLTDEITVALTEQKLALRRLKQSPLLPKDE
jgi:DNA primase